MKKIEKLEYKEPYYRDEPYISIPGMWSGSVEEKVNELIDWQNEMVETWEVLIATQTIPEVVLEANTPQEDRPYGIEELNSLGSLAREAHGLEPLTSDTLFSFDTDMYALWSMILSFATEGDFPMTTDDFKVWVMSNYQPKLLKNNGEDTK